MTKASDAVREMLIIVVGVLTIIASIVTIGDRLVALKSRTAEAIVRPIPSVQHYDETPAHAFDRTPIAPPGSIGSIDEARATSEHIIVRGWIVRGDRKLARHVFAIVDGNYRYEITRDYGVPRPDVAVYLNQADLSNSGIDTTLSAIGLAKGSHRLTLAVFLEPNNALYPIGATRIFYID